VDVDSVSAEQRFAYRRDCGIPDDCRFVVTTIGRLISYRRPWLYIPVFARIAERLGEDVHFIMGGDGVEAQRIHALIKKHKLERQVHMVGLVREIELPLAISDAFVSLNLDRWTGVVAFQAASARVPLVGVQMREDYVARAEDWIWSSSDTAAVADRVVELLLSPPKRSEVVERQSEHLQEHHSADAMMRSYYALYDAALKRRDQRRGASRNELESSRLPRSD
jgi:glycosyltransferase involved in cell wall biosynthesis